MQLGLCNAVQWRQKVTTSLATKKPAWTGQMLTATTAASDKVSHSNTQDMQLLWKQIPCFLGSERAGMAAACEVSLSSFSLLFMENMEKIFPARSLMPK